MNCKKLLKQIIFALCVLFVIAASLLWLTDHARNKAVPVSDAAPPASQSQSITVRPGPASYSDTGLTVRSIDAGQIGADIFYHTGNKSICLKHS
mgnify:CR=1 FL=1